MKISIQDTTIIHKDKIYNRKQFDNREVTSFNYFWFLYNCRVSRSLEEELEAEYQKLNPNKTLNPSELKDLKFDKNEVGMITDALRFHAHIFSKDITMTEWCTKRYNLSIKVMDNFKKKGFVNLDDLIKEFQEQYFTSKPNYNTLKKFGDFIVNKLQANGETPEEANPVAQIIMNDGVLKFINKTLIETGFFSDKWLEITIGKYIKHNNKALETTKEQPYVVIRPHCTPSKIVIMANSKKDAIDQSTKNFGFCSSAKATMCIKRGIILTKG